MSDRAARVRAALTTMPRLHVRTPLSWADSVLPFVDELLVEQAQLEKKAAAGALAFLFRYPEERGFARALSEVAREELTHFERTLTLLESRGIQRRKLRPGPYAARLGECLRVREPERLLDQLVVSAVIEARSAERMFVLSQALHGVDDELAAFYASLVASEARHQSLYLELARQRFEAATVELRLEAVLAHEAELLAHSTNLPRLHDGAPLAAVRPGSFESAADASRS